MGPGRLHGRDQHEGRRDRAQGGRRERFVAGSIGPTGFLPASEDPSLGQIRFGELVEVFAEQAAGLIDGGADLLIIETAQDILEVKAAIFGAREAFKSTGRTLPIHTSVSLLPNGGKMLLGTDISAVLTTLEALKVDVIGLNCSTGPEDMRDAIRFLGEFCPVPVACIPNAGLPLQGPDGETIFPEQPEPLAEALKEFVERYGVGIVGGCCGTTPEHIAAIAERVGGPRRRPAPGPAPAAPLLDDRRDAAACRSRAPTMVGERVNSQGSRKAKELLLADDYDGLVQIAEDQVTGGAHVLDLCVALTERTDEDEQMRLLAKKVSLTQPAPIQIDSTEPEVIERALEQIPGRAIVNSVNLEAGPRQARPRGAGGARARRGADRADDRRGRHGEDGRSARSRSPSASATCAARSTASTRELLIFDCLTFTLTTGDEEWRPSAVETIEGIKRDQGGDPAREDLAGRLERLLRRLARARARCSTRSSCTTASRRAWTWRWSTRTTSRPTPRSPTTSASSPTTSCSTAARTRWSASSSTSSPRARRRARQGAADPTEGMEPEEALHFHILRRRKDGVEDWIDRSVEKIGAVPTLNEVLLPAMKEVGDKFGAGELILPFVLQSAEVMKRAVAQLEKYLDKIEGYTKGTVVLATVFGDVHDIGKSLVNTILTNNGYTVVDLGKQVPIQTIVDAAQEHDATAIGLSALLVSTSKQMPACIQELHAKGLAYPVLIGGAAINRAFSYRALYPGGKDSEEVYEPGVFYCKDAFEGLSVMDQLIDADARGALVEKLLARRDRVPREGRGARGGAELRRRLGALAGAHRRARSPRRRSGACRRSTSTSTRSTATSTRTCCSSCTGAGAASKARPGRRCCARTSARAWSACGASRTTCTRARCSASSPATRWATTSSCSTPRTATTELTRFVCPRQPKGDRICLADFFRPARRRQAAGGARRDRRAGGDRRRGGHRADGQAGGRRRVRRAAVRARPRRADGRGPGRVAALARAREMLGIDAHAGPALLVGLPGRARAVRAPEGREAARPRRRSA